MQLFLRNIFLIIIPLIIYIFGAMIFMPKIIANTQGPSTKEQLNSSFSNSVKREYDLLIMGNSRMYRGINPDKFDYSAFNFSHDNDSFNQIYYKLEFLLKKNKKFKLLILGVDYFQFSFISDTRNYIYSDLLSNDYLIDYNRTVIHYKIEHYLTQIKPSNIRWLFHEDNKSFIKDNGQYIRPGFANENDAIIRDINRLPIQVKYFKKILKICKKHNIKVVMITLPTRVQELQSYDSEEIQEFVGFIKAHVDGKRSFYIDYSRLDDFKTSDYTDITHFNEDAANRFTTILSKDLSRLILTP